MQAQFENLIQSQTLNYKLPNSFFNVVNFSPVIECIHNLSITKVSEFDSEIKLNNTQHKKYIFHYFIYYTCEILKNYNKKYKPVIFFDVSNDLNKKYLPFLDMFIKKFPVIILKEDFSFNKFKKNLKCNGRREEAILILTRKLQKMQLKPFYFNKLQYFCKKYDLTFLDKTYFNDMRNKLSLL